MEVISQILSQELWEGLKDKFWEGAWQNEITVLYDNTPWKFKIMTTMTQRREEVKYHWPFHSQDLFSNSPYCLSYNSYDTGTDNLVLDQLASGCTTLLKFETNREDLYYDIQ